MSLTPDKEKQFTLAYHARIKKLQDKCEEGRVVYTKITLSFALLHDLTFIELLFHPKSVSKHFTYERAEFSTALFKQTLEEIIIWELNQSLDGNTLTSQQLLKIIECFRTLEQKRLS